MPCPDPSRTLQISLGSSSMRGPALECSPRGDTGHVSLAVALAPAWESHLNALQPTRKRFVYVEPSRRVKEILEEELYFQKEACQVKHPAAVALEGIWSVEKDFSIGSLKSVTQNRNGLLLKPQFYSRHAGMK
ncbi:PREDICTED: uncharacterized protein LOC104628107, partial [Phaethon lepturus]|uniref:uncharacterized protein LOC104628107 n=1 Tax=Phaethon lepturus TaxID=97097 RepID=UPI0005307182